MNPRIQRCLLQNGPMLDTPRLVDIYHLLAQVLIFAVPGDVVELGCHAGQCAILLRELLDHFASTKTLHVYDAFRGLPEHHAADAGAVFPAGALRASREDLLGNFARMGLQPPIVHEGWFHDTLPHELPEQICFAHIDADLYQSILDALHAVYPRLTRSAIVVIDDYDWEGLPGANQAVDEFLRDRPEQLCRMRLGPRFDAAHAFFQRL